MNKYEQCLEYLAQDEYPAYFEVMNTEEVHLYYVDMLQSMFVTGVDCLIPNFKGLCVALAKQSFKDDNKSFINEINLQQNKHGFNQYICYVRNINNCNMDTVF